MYPRKKISHPYWHMASSLRTINTQRMKSNSSFRMNTHMFRFLCDTGVFCSHTALALWGVGYCMFLVLLYNAHTFILLGFTEERRLQTTEKKEIRTLTLGMTIRCLHWWNESNCSFWMWATGKKKKPESFTLTFLVYFYIQGHTGWPC